MCVTYYQVNYCQDCVSYIESYLLGTVLCEDQRQKTPCEARIEFHESGLQGPCAACRRPVQVTRRSQRIRWMRRNGQLPKSYREDATGRGDEDAGDDEDAGTDDDSGEDGSEGSDSGARSDEWLSD